MNRTVAARRWYWTAPVMGSRSELVRVTGWEDVNGQEWCRVRFASDGARLLMHPAHLQGLATDAEVAAFAGAGK